jgi:sugar lactone lactonase YvrE
MYWTDQGTNDIRRANLDGTEQQALLFNQTMPTYIDLDVPAGKLYWTNQTEPSGDIRRANLDGSQEQTVVPGLSTPDGIALDPAAGKMYWTGGLFGANIRRANLDGTDPQTLVTGQSIPAGLARDVAHGKMYWTEFTGGDIRRANLDGTEQETVVTNLNEPTDVALDVADGKIYWTDAPGADPGQIRRANLDGSGQEVVVTGLTRGPTGIALDLPQGNIYWTDYGAGDIRRANLDGTAQQILVLGLSRPVGIALQLPPAAPSVTCLVANSLLWPSNHRLVNVGLSVDVQPRDATLQLQVYANDDANATDAADIAPGTLQLRSERQGDGEGRVYLIVATATNAGGTSFDVCTVVVPHDQSSRSIATVEAAAASAETYYREFQTPPPGYRLIGAGMNGVDTHRLPAVMGAGMAADLKPFQAMISYPLPLPEASADPTRSFANAPNLSAAAQESPMNRFLIADSDEPPLAVCSRSVHELEQETMAWVPELANELW